MVWQVSTLTGESGPVHSAMFANLNSKPAVQLLTRPRHLCQVSTLQGHAGPVHSAMFSPDGKRVVAGYLDDCVRLFDVATSARVIS